MVAPDDLDHSRPAHDDAAHAAQRSAGNSRSLLDGIRQLFRRPSRNGTYSVSVTDPQEPDFLAEFFCQK